jgi:heme exporter protein D
MEETKEPQSSYSDERTEITGPNSLRGATATAEAAKSEKPEPLSEQLQGSAKAGSTQNPANERSAHKPVAATLPLKVSSANAPSAIARTAQYSPFADLFGYFERTKYVWLGLFVAAVVLMAMSSVMKGRAERARVAREQRRETAATTITPESLIARCGPAAEDVTKQMYPMILRTMSYRSQELQKVVFEFSRTAEEKSDWVFLSMKDESGAKRYDTPEVKISALPCLDSNK